MSPDQLLSPSSSSLTRGSDVTKFRRRIFKAEERRERPREWRRDEPNPNPNPSLSGPVLVRPVIEGGSGSSPAGLTASQNIKSEAASGEILSDPSVGKI